MEKELSLGWKAVKPRPLRFVSCEATGQEEKLLKTCEAARNMMKVRPG